MLLKLFKYDFKNVAKIGLPISLVMVLTSVLASLSARFIFTAFETENEMLAESVFAVSMFVQFTWLIAMIAYAIAIKFIVVYRYYTHFFTDQGYLTFTLPCKSSTHFKSKILNGLLWDLISTLVLVGCVVIEFIGIIGGYDLGRDLWNAFDIYSILFGGYDVFSTPVIRLAQIILKTVFSSISGLLILYIAVTIGAMVAKKHKIAASVGLYFAISWSFSLIETLAELIPQFVILADYTYVLSGGAYERMVNTSGWITSSIVVGLHLTAIIVSYFLNKHFLNKKLNLA